MPAQAVREVRRLQSWLRAGGTVWEALRVHGGFPLAKLLPGFLAKSGNRGRQSKALCERRIHFLKTQEREAN